MQDAPRGIAKMLILGLLWLTGVYMRAPMLIAAPLGERIQATLDLSETSVGALTTLPVLMLGLAALPAAWLIGRFGARSTLLAALLLTAVASALRGAAPGLAILLLATAVMGIGIAAMQPALPALVGRWCPGFVALGSAVYINGMMLGEFVGAGLTLPLLLPLVGDDWRLALALFPLPAFVLAPLLLRPRLYGSRPRMDRVRKLPDWRDRQLWVFGALLGTTAATFFGLNAYMGSLLAHRGLGEHLDVMLFVFNLAQVVASILMMGAAYRVLRIPRLLFLTAALHVVGLAGVVLADGLWLLLGAAVGLSFASALQLISAVTLPPLLRSPDEAGKLAAGMFAVGYVLAFVIPLLAGLVADTLGNANAVAWLFLGCNALCLPLAWRTRATTVD